jgi:hypothetical protein
MPIFNKNGLLYIPFCKRDITEFATPQRGFQVVSCCVELAHYKAGKGEGKYPGVFSVWGFSMIITM